MIGWARLSFWEAFRLSVWTSAAPLASALELAFPAESRKPERATDAPRVTELPLQIRRGWFGSSLVISLSRVPGAVHRNSLLLCDCVVNGHRNFFGTVGSSVPLSKRIDGCLIECRGPGRLGYGYVDYVSRRLIEVE